MSIRFTALLSCAFSITIGGVPANADEQPEAYNYRERTRQLAFDPNRFFDKSDYRPLEMSIIYSGDDYGYPVYSLAVRRGCTAQDTGEARKHCGRRMTARMVRAPYDGEPERPRFRGMKLFGYLSDKKVTNDTALVAALDAAQLEWREADVNACQPALDHLNNADQIPFFAVSPSPEYDDLAIVIHADKITFEYGGGYLTNSRYYGYRKRGSAGEWADQFAASLENCWKPTTAPAPWKLEPVDAVEG